MRTLWDSIYKEGVAQTSIRYAFHICEEQSNLGTPKILLADTYPVERFALTSSYFVRVTSLQWSCR